MRYEFEYEQKVYVFCQTSGSVFSPWVEIRTMEASPAGLSNITVEQREQGRALLLSWDQPHAPNGVITVRAMHMTSLHTSVVVKTT